MSPHYSTTCIVRWRRTGMFAALAFMALVVVPPTPVFAQSAQTDIVLVLDNSGSMRKNDPEFLLKRAVSKFITDLGADTHVGIVIFDQKVSYPNALAPLDAGSRAAISGTLDKIDYRGQLTNSPAAIERAIYELKSTARADAAKVIIFMTDGIVDTGDAEIDKDKTKWMREELAADAADSAIKVFGIAFTDNADFFLIQSLAKKTDGEYFRALTPEDLGTVFTSVREKLATASTPAPPPAPTAAPVAAVTAPSMTTPPPPTSAPAAAQNCLDTLVAEERALMEEAAPDAGITAEQLCREMMQAEPGTAVVVRPPEELDDDDKRGIFLIIGLAALALLVIVGLVVFVLRRRGAGAATAGARAAGSASAVVPEAFLKDINGITGEPATQIGAKPMVIGRVAGTDPSHLDYFVIDKGTIGRRHALVQYRDYCFWIVDQGSVNGTFLNGERIENERQLKHGDRVKFHKYEFEFSMPEMGDGGNTVFADPFASTMIGEATMVGTAAHMASNVAPLGSADDVFDMTPAAQAHDMDEFFDDDAATALSDRQRATSVAGDETAESEIFDDIDDNLDDGGMPVAKVEQSASDFDAEASAFFDEDDLGQTSGPRGLEQDDFEFDEAETALPVVPGKAEEHDFSESETLAPAPPYADDGLSGTSSDISVDDFMETESFSAPLLDVGDDEEDATVMPHQVPHPHSRPLAIDDVFDITSEGTIPPAHPNAIDDEDESEAPTKFRD